jgi:CO dehydrogenase maturation factor
MIAESIDSIIEKSIITITNDKGAFSLLSMGQPQQAGCFCASNNLLRDIVEDVIHKYPIVLIDCEAGIEQINRKVIQSVDYLLIITDLSTRSIETAQNIHNMAKQFTKFRKAGIIINRVKKGLDVYNYPQIRDLDIPIIGILPDDDCLLDIELNSKDLLQLSEDSVYYKAIVDLQF